MASRAVRDAIVKAATSLGYSMLKLEQEQIIASFVSVFVVLLTGYGKSLCFVLLPRVRVPGLSSKRRSPFLLYAPYASNSPCTTLRNI